MPPATSRVMRAVCVRRRLRCAGTLGTLVGGLSRPGGRPSTGHLPRFAFLDTGALPAHPSPPATCRRLPNDTGHTNELSAEDARIVPAHGIEALSVVPAHGTIKPILDAFSIRRSGYLYGEYSAESDCIPTVNRFQSQDAAISQSLAKLEPWFYGTSIKFKRIKFK